VPAAKALLDLHGDPLPPGAIARYGTVRLRHGASPGALGFSLDGKMLASVSSTEEGIRIWVPATGKELYRLNIPVHLAALGRDGSIVIIREGRAKVWIPGADMLRDLPEEALPEAPQAICVHPDGRSFAAAVQNKVILIDLHTGKHIREFKCPAEQGATRLTFSADGQWLAGSGQKSGVWLWSYRTGKRVRTYRTNHDLAEYSFSPDSTRIAVAGEQIRVYPLDSEEVVDGYKPTEAVFQCPTWSHDGKWLYAIDQSGTVAQVSAETGEFKESWKAPQEGFRAPMTLSPDGRYAAALDQDGGIRIWDPRTGKGPEAERIPPPSAPGFSSDGKTVWCQTADGHIHGFEAATGKPVRVIDLLSNEADSVLGWDPVSRRAVLGSDEGSREVRLLDVDRKRVLAKIVCSENSPTPLVYLASRDRSRAAFFEMGSVRVINLDTGRAIRKITIGDPESSPALRGGISPDGRLVAIVTTTITVWEASSGKKRFDFQGFANPEGAVFSPDGSGLAAWDGNGNIALFNLRLGTIQRRFTTSGVDTVDTAVAFSADSKRLAAFGRDGEILVWDIATGETLATLLRHEGTISGLAFSPDGSWLASTCLDGTVLVWDITRRAAPVVQENTVTGTDEALRLLGSPDAGAAQRGLEFLYRRPAEAIKAISEAIPVPAALPPERLAAFIDELASEDFPTRQAALKRLQGLGMEAAPALRQAAEKSTDPEVRKLASEALAYIESAALGAADERVIRAVEFLENIGSPEARAILAKWASGPRGHRMTTEAAAALERMKSSKP
jgi:WD40 repeat protein